MHCCLTESRKGTLRDATCHRGLTDNQDIFLQRLIPQLQGEGTIDLAVLLRSLLQACTIDRVGSIERIEATLRVDLKDTALRMEDLIRHPLDHDLSWSI